MEHLDFSVGDSQFKIEGFPDAAKVIRLDGPLANRLSDLSLHKTDLDFADECLDAINSTPEDPSVIREALWRSAIIHFLKCFGDAGARFHLSPEKILKGESPTALVAFNYFKDLRNKHLVHDENTYTQSIPSAILNNGNKPYKIDKIVCLAARGITLVPGNYSNLKMLITKTRTWVVAEFDQVCDLITKELESESYKTLFAKESASYRVPSIEELPKNRKSP